MGSVLGTTLNEQPKIDREQLLMEETRRERSRQILMEILKNLKQSKVKIRRLILTPYTRPNEYNYQKIVVMYDCYVQINSCTPFELFNEDKNYIRGYINTNYFLPP